MTDVSLAHLSDLHLSTPRPVLGDLTPKRILSYLSWKRRRRHIHSPRVLAALASDLERTGPDAIVITGDLTHLGLAGEFAEARAWIEGLVARDRVFVVPGNHDIYRRTDESALVEHLGRFLLAARPDTHGFPGVRDVGGVTLIGANSAVPAPILLATGRLGTEQLRLIETALIESRDAGRMRILALHHPPFPGQTRWRKRLTDAKKLAEIISRTGCELVLHGHTHTARVNRTELVTGQRCTVISSASGTALDPRPRRVAQYNLLRISARYGRRTVELTPRIFDPTSGSFLAGESVDLLDEAAPSAHEA